MDQIGSLNVFLFLFELVGISCVYHIFSSDNLISYLKLDKNSRETLLKEE